MYIGMNQPGVTKFKFLMNYPFKMPIVSVAIGGGKLMEQKHLHKWMHVTVGCSEWSLKCYRHEERNTYTISAVCKYGKEKLYSAFSEFKP